MQTTGGASLPAQPVWSVLVANPARWSGTAFLTLFEKQTEHRCWYIQTLTENVLVLVILLHLLHCGLGKH